MARDAAYYREYYARNRDRIRERQRLWKERKRQEDPERYRSKYDRAGALRRNYGLTVEEFDTMVLAQEGRCALCDRPSDLVVDHDHRTGRVRALLCTRCNTGLGHFGDAPALLERAVAYLVEAA